MKGLAAIQATKQKLEDLESHITTTVRLALQYNEDWIVDLNAHYQLYEKGVNALGIEIASYDPYTMYTVMLKGMQGQPTDRVTLQDTGDFHRSFYVIFRDDEFEITAYDHKKAELVDRYGPEIFGLTPEHMTILRQEIVKPSLEEMLASYGNR